MQTVLITGASGFIGHHLMRSLSDSGYRVLGTTSKIIEPGFVVCDITDYYQVQNVFEDAQPDIIIHAAGLSSVTKSQAMDYYRVNVGGTENVIEAIQTLGGRKRIIFLSSATVYGNQNVEVLGEDLSPKPVNHYGYSKFIAERLMCAAAEKHDVTILRLFNVIGAGQDESFIVPKLVRHFKDRATQIELGNIASQRDYLPVSTLTTIVSELIDLQDSYGETINVCQGDGTSVQELLKILEDLTNHKIDVKVSEKFLRRNEVWRLVGDVRKLERILGHAPHHSDLVSTLQGILNAPDS